MCFLCDVLGGGGGGGYQKWPIVLTPWAEVFSRPNAQPIRWCAYIAMVVCRSDLIDWTRVCRQTPRENLQLAFDIAERVFNVTRLLDPEGN